MADRTFSSTLIHTCDIYSRTLSTSTIIGEQEYIFSLVNSDVKCRISLLKGVELLSRDGQFTVDRYCGYFEVDTVIKKDDVVEFNGLRLSVQSVDDEAGSGHHLRVILETLSQ